MTDSPMVRAPLDPREQPILDHILTIRDRLCILKQDRSTYVKSQDVESLYKDLIGQVELLNSLRTNKRSEQNRVDTVLDDCFQLISLFYLTIGRNHEAPAVYAATSTVKRLLDHLKEAAFFSMKDLDSISQRIIDMKESIERGRDTYSPHLLTLLEARIRLCETLLLELQQVLAKLSPDLAPVYEKLVSILRSLSACNTRSKFPTSEVLAFKDQLLEIQEQLDETVLPKDARTPEERYADTLKNLDLDESKTEGRKLVLDLLARCLLWVDIVLEKQGKIDERFQDTYDKLLTIRNQLEKLSITQAWSLRETDLYGYQRQLDRIDEARIDGNFVDGEGAVADLHAQRTLLYLLRKSYAYIYQLMVSSEPVSEALLPVYNQLMTLKRCLIEVKRSGGVETPRELYPYSMKLNSIDNMKVDGKFMIGNDIPEGQAAVTALLSECFEMAYDLRTEAEERGDDEREDDGQAQDGITV